MVKWGDHARDFDVPLAIWPVPDRSYDRWWMQELIEQTDGSVKWRDRRIPTESGHVRMDVHLDVATAKASVESLNPLFAGQLAQRDINPEAKRSLQLKVQKALLARERLQNEEGLMLAEAIRRNAAMPRPTAANVRLDPDTESIREELMARLQEMPYLKAALVGSPRSAVFLRQNGKWSAPRRVTRHGAALVARAEIANGFGFSHEAHWGRCKAAIRKILLPRANQLLQLAGVQRMLAEALARGEKVLVCGPYVFWYEEDGSIGWQVKMTHSDRVSEGATVWKEGTILSTNHGRLVILPYIKEDGEKVRGHTRNAPGDGKALPRHPDHFADIPFREISGDLMIGLFGELPYE
jgi:hypothetical protein